MLRLHALHKRTLVQALRFCTGRTAHRGSRGIVLLFLDRGTRRGWEVSVTPRPLFTLGKDPVPTVQEAGWAPGTRTTYQNCENRDGWFESTAQTDLHSAVGLHSCQQGLLTLYSKGLQIPPPPTKCPRYCLMDAEFSWGDSLDRARRISPTAASTSCRPTLTFTEFHPFSTAHQCQRHFPSDRGGGANGWGTALQTRSQVRFPTVPLELFTDIILPAALWRWGWLSPNRNEYKEYFLWGKSGRCVGLTTLPPSCAVLKCGSHNLLGLLGTVQVCNGIALPLLPFRHEFAKCCT